MRATTGQLEPRLAGGRALRFTPVGPPYRRDRTVSVLQRLPSNPVDVWADGAYLRALDGAVLHPFPPAATLADAPEALLRAAGLSGAKARALRAAARA